MNELEKKILWQCRRGLWELDAILIPFLQNNFATLSDEEIQLFRKLLAYEDIEIFDILMGDDVSKRKNFINTNAINVNNLDI